MRPFTSRAGWTCTAIYLAGAIWIVQNELRYSGGGWISLRGMMAEIVTAPSQATLGTLLRRLGVPKVNYDHPGVAGYAEIVSHVLLTAALVYLVGWGLEWVVRRMIQGHA